MWISGKSGVSCATETIIDFGDFAALKFGISPNKLLLSNDVTDNVIYVEKGVQKGSCLNVRCDAFLPRHLFRFVQIGTKA
jgi:hypothetical protein